MDEMQRVLRELLSARDGSGHGAPDASSPSSNLCLLYFTSDWAAPVDARVQLALSDAAASMHVVALRQHLVDVGADNSSAVLGAVAERAVPRDTFRLLCKHFGITTLPSCAVVDASKDTIAEAQIPSGVRIPQTLLLENGEEHASLLEKLRKSAPSQTSESQLARMRDEATSCFENGEFLDAARRFVDVLVESPTCPKASFNLAVILQTMGETYFAVHFMLQVVASDDSDSVAHTVLRSVYYQEEPQAVVAGYEAIITRFPHHVRAVHSLATLRGRATTAAPAYVKEVFDELAETFEEKLVTHLEYRVPWLLVDALKKVEPRVFAASKVDGEDEALDAASEASSLRWSVADVGCGTGLCGRLLRPFVGHVVGVDISPLMIEKTRDAGSYDELHTDDIGPFLTKREDASLDLVISADVWIYVGALEEIFALCSRKLKPRGWLAFSTELLQTQANDRNESGYKLAASGRFQHSETYVSTLAEANGFAIRVQDAIGVRKESGEAIPGRIYLLRKQ